MANPTDIGTIVDQSTVISTAWGQGINDWVYGSYGVLGSTFTADAFRAAVGALSQPEVTNRINSFTAATSANTLVITLPATTMDFRSATASSGAVTTRTIAAPVTLTISNGSTLGMTNGETVNFVVLAFDTGSTIELGIARADQGFSFSENDLKSTTAEGGVGGADTAGTIYSTNALTNRPYRIVGYFRISQATAGVWVSNPTVIQGTGGAVQDALPIERSLATDGYYKFPGGLIVQWGQATTSGGAGQTTENFPIPFPTSCIQVVATATVTANVVAVVASKTNDYVILYTHTGSTGAAANATVRWIAIGY